MTRWILKNRHAVWALVIAIFVFGVFAYQRLPVQLFPDTAPPLVNVMTAYPGAAAEDVAQDLSRRLEEEFASLDGVFRVESSSQDNMSVVSVEFQYDRDVDLAAVDVQNAIARIRGALPSDIHEPRVLKFSTADRPIVTYAVTAEDLTRARKLAEDVFAPRLQRIPGVAAVDVFGGSRGAILVELCRYELESARIPLQRVVEALHAHNVMTPAGRIRTDSASSMFRVDTRAETVGALEDIPITTALGSRVLLGDIGTIRRDHLPDDSRFRLNGRRAIAMQVFKTTEANTVDVVREARDVVEMLASSYSGIDIAEGEESAGFAQTSVDSLMGNIGLAILFTAILMFFFLRQWKSSLIAAFTMPLSFCITFAIMKLLGLDLNLVTLSAIILSVGIVIDNSVIVLENIVRRREQDGLSPVDAAVEGTDEIRGAALGGTLTNVAVLLPLLFLPGFTGKTFGPLALTLLIAVCSSIVVALLLVPLFSIFASSTQRDATANRIALLVTGPFQVAMDRLKRFYILVLRVGLRNRWAVLLAAAGMFVGGIVGIRMLGMDVLPRMDSGAFYISLETPSGSSLEETERVVREVEALLQEEDEVRLVQSQVGFEQGMRSLSSFGAQGPTQGFISVTLTDRNQRDDTVWNIQTRVREGIARIPGIWVSTVRESGNTARATTSAPIVVRISGDDPLVIDRLGSEVEQRISQVPSLVSPTRNWRIDQRQGRLHVDVLRAAALGISPAMVGRTVLAGTDGLMAGDYHGDGGSPLPIRVSYREDQRSTPEDLLRLPMFTTVTRDPVPLGELVDHGEVLAPSLISRVNLSRTLEVSAFIDGRPLSFVASDVARVLSEINPPEGYRVELAGERDDLAESRGELGIALFIGVIVVYLLLVAQFRSFVHPFTVLMSVPLSLAGIAAALWLTGKPVSMPVMVGLILIVGTVIKSAILLVSFIEQQRDRGVDLNEALFRAVDLRFRPIMMTSFSTVAGMIPLAAEWSLGSERFSPLAIAVIGGFVTSTFLTIFLIPVLYSVLDGTSARNRRSESGRIVAKCTAIVLLAALALPGAAVAQERVSLTLAESVEMSLAHNRKVAMRRDEAEAAGFRRRQAEGRFLPKLSLSARYSLLSHVEPGTLELPMPLPDGSLPDPVQFGESINRQYSLRLALEQPLYTGKALSSGWRAAGHAEDLARERLRAEEADVRALTEEAYLQFLTALEMIKVAERSEATLTEHLRKVEALYASGRVTNLDVSRVRSRLAGARLSVVRSRGAFEVVHLALTSLIGVPSSTELELVDVLKELALAAAPSASELMAEALDSRPELAMARHAAAATSARADVESAALRPQLFMRFGYNYERPNQRYFPPRDRFDDSWDLSVVLSWTIWDWGVTHYGARAARAEATSAARQVDGVRDSVRLDVERRLREYETHLEAIVASRQSLTSAELALGGAKKLFDEGRVTSLDVLDAETEATLARTAYLQNIADARISWSRVERSVGPR